MNDEMLFERLASHEGPAALDRAFEERLYSILEREMRRGRSLRPALLLAATLVLVLTITAAIAVGSGLITPDATATPTPTRLPPSPPVALKGGPLQAGTYAAHPFSAPNDSLSFTFNVPDGWVGDLPGSVAPTAGTGGPDGAGVDFLQVTGLYTDSCTSDFVLIGPSVDELASGLEEIYGVEPSYEVTAPVDVTLSGYSGKRMDLLIPSDVDFSSCRNGGYPFGEGAPYARGDGNRWHLWILEVAWERVVILAHDFATTSPQDQAELLAIVDSIRIDPPSTRGWPGGGENPPGRYSWGLGSNTGSGAYGWMHNGYQTLDEGQGVAISFGSSSDADPDAAAVIIAGYPGTYQERISTEASRTELWTIDIEGWTFTITLEAEWNTTAAQLAEAHAIIESIRYEPTETGGLRVTFTLPFGWDSG
jgi:hypothetical protein